MRKLFKMLWNNRGELDLGGKETFTAAEVTSLVEKQITGLVDAAIQPKIDNIVQSRLAQQQNKYVNYDELVKFKTDHETSTAAATQKQLEDQGRYEEALKGHNTKVEELNAVIVQKDGTITSMNIGNALTGEIVTQGGYLEETLAMLKSSAEIKEGIVTIKGKDANGLDQSFSVADGVKSFLEKRPHLVKTKVNDGGGDSGGGDNGDGGADQGSEDLTTLNDMLAKQIYANDIKGAAETKAKIKTLMAKEGKTIANSVAY